MTSDKLIDMARVKLAANRVRAYLAARASSKASSDIIGIHAESACILSGADLHLILAALPTVPEAENAVPEQALTRLAAPQSVQHSGTVSWVNCPVCDEPDMRQTADEDGNALINCVNHGCPSNGGN